MVEEPASDVIMEMGDEVMSAGVGDGPMEKTLALEKESGSGSFCNLWTACECVTLCKLLAAVTAFLRQGTSRRTEANIINMRQQKYKKMVTGS